MLKSSLEGQPFTLSDYRGSRILLSFFRNGSCALCNLRVHQLIQVHDQLRAKGLKVVAVFESSPEQMQPYVGQQQPPFVLLADPQAHLYSLYGVESSPEKVNRVMQQQTAEAHLLEATQRGFPLIAQENTNFFRMPADFLIDEAFRIRQWHYSDQLTDHLPLDDIMAFAARQSHFFSEER